MGRAPLSRVNRAQSQRQRPESEAKIEIIHEGIHLRGNAGSRSQVVEPMWDE